MAGEPADLDDWAEHPWEQYPGERGEQYAAFLWYLQSPIRTIEHVISAYNGIVSGSLIRRWAKEFGWLPRAERFDAWRNGLLRDELEKRSRMTAEQVGQQFSDSLQAFLGTLTREMRKYERESLSSGQPVMRPNELRQATKTAVEMYRLLNNQPTEIVGDGAEDFSKLSDDELERLRGLMAKARGESP